MTKAQTKKAAPKKAKAPAKKESVLRTATAVYSIKGVKPKVVEDYFEGKKVGATHKSKDLFVLTYTAKGAARGDIQKRFPAFIAKNEGAEIEFVELVKAS